MLRLADLVDETMTASPSAFGGWRHPDLFAGGGSVELNGVANPGINNLADLADFITVDFG